MTISKSEKKNKNTKNKEHFLWSYTVKSFKSFKSVEKKLKRLAPAAQVSKQASKEIILKMSTPTRTTRESACPPAPKRRTREEVKAMMEEVEEKNRQKMMEEATHNLEYLKTLRHFAEKTSCPSIKVKADMMRYFNTKILDLETDVLGKPRYSFNLHYPTDIGFAPNGRPPVFGDKKFSSVAEISKFISQYIKSEDMMFDKENYNLPTVFYIEDMLLESGKCVIDVNDEDEDEDEEKVPPFTVTCTRINY